VTGAASRPAAPGPGTPGDPAPGHASAAAPKRIGIFRALMLGDMLCAVPALRAVSAAWPDAELVLIGLRWARPLAERLPMVHRFVEFPGWPGLPEAPTTHVALPGFLHAMQSERFDLLLQLHGSGQVVNPLLAACAPRRLVGFTPDGGDDGVIGAAADRVRWPEQGHEVERLLALTDRLGLPRQGTQLEFPLRPHDRLALQQQWPAVDDAQPYVVVHPGARLASRRWMPASFASVADRIAARGWRVVLTGGEAEEGLTAEVRGLMKHPAVDLAGVTDLWTLGALIERAALLVCNDTGVSHIAAALATPSVVISCGADASRFAPQDVLRHATLWQPAPCRPCHHDRCPSGHECATTLPLQAVDHAVRQRLGMPA
jgi:ADP-heptose:LPS heptosyltransferase